MSLSIGTVGMDFAEDVVQAPDGTWTCSDDADGSDPAVTVDGGAGTYSVWIGTYSRRTDSVAATLSVE